MTKLAPITRCPVCARDLEIRRLHCSGCGISIEGVFHQLGWIRKLTPEQLGFLKVFVESRGKIKDVEAALGISYPTVVGRLEDLVRAVADDLSPRLPPPSDQSAERMQILDDLAQGRIEATDAAQRLRKL